MISVSIVNRFYPPDPAITGVSAQELAEFLAAEIPEARVHAFASRARYSGGRVADHGGIEVTRIRSFYDGSHKLLRLAASLFEGFRLALAATRHADVVISLTDPPLLGLWIGLMRRFRRFRWMEWTMDLYPEAFAAARLVGRGNPIYRALHRIVRGRLPDRYLALGPQQCEFLGQARGEVPSFVVPCGISAHNAGPPPDWRTEFPNHVILAYAGNLGEAHSVEILTALVRRADPQRFRFLLALYGARADAARAALSGAPHVIWRDQVSHADLAHADVHVAMLKPSWTHLCVPSKAVSSICLGRPLLFAGSERSDNWSLLQAAGWLIRERDDATFDESDVDRALAAMASPRELAEKSAQALRLRAELLQDKERAFRDIAQWVGQTAGERGLARTT